MICKEVEHISSIQTHCDLSVKNKKIKLYHNRYKPWITHSILNSVYEKIGFYQNLKKNKTLESKQKYINYKNKLTS